MKVARTRTETEQIQALMLQHATFHKVFQNDFTQEVLNDLRNKLYGKIPRNWLLNITGLVGTPTGIFKSSMGLQLALELDPLFTVEHRVGFSINSLMDKVQENTEYSLCSKCFSDFKKSYIGTYETINEKKDKQCDNCDNLAEWSALLTKMVFFLDEQTKTLKTGGLVRLQNLMDTVRQRQICLITCGVDEYNMHFTTYHLQRVQESSDDYLPKKRVRYAVYDDKRDLYYGFFQWDIIPLSNLKWKDVWDKYSLIKQNFQRVAMAQQISSMAFEEYAQEIMESEDFPNCWRNTKRGLVIDTPIAKNIIYKKYPDLTEAERNMILSELKLMAKRGDLNNGDNDDDNDEDGDLRLNL